MTRTIHCMVDDIDTEGLDFPPWPSEAGLRVYREVGKPAWRRWLAHQTMLINENRLGLADPRARKYLAAQMEKYFFSGGAEIASGYVPPAK